LGSCGLIAGAHRLVTRGGLMTRELVTQPFDLPLGIGQALRQP